jgi:hypothetical protein
MTKIILPLLFVLSFPATLHAENKLKRIIYKDETILVPKSAKLMTCKDLRKEYSIITEDLCKVNFKDD